MGMGSFSENCGHQAAVLAAETLRQSAMTALGAAPPQAAVSATEIAFYRAALASAIANGCSPEQYIMALRELGTGGV